MHYARSLRLMHWLMALLILSLLGVGLYMSNVELPREQKFALYGIHKAAGMIAFLLVIIRFGIRQATMIPPLTGHPKIQQLAAHLTHTLLYVCMLAMPVSGYLMSTYGGYPITVLGWQVPMVVAPNKDLGGVFHEIHELTGYTLLAIIAVHIGATVYNGIRGHGVFHRIKLRLK